MTAGSLAAFLLARWDEQEAAARGPYVDLDPVDSTHQQIHDPAYVLADIEAKRGLVERALSIIASFDDWDAAEARGAGGSVMWSDVSRRERSHAHLTMRTLAQPFADHADFDPRWLQ